MGSRRVILPDWEWLFEDSVQGGTSIKTASDVQLGMHLSTRELQVYRTRHRKLR